MQLHRATHSPNIGPRDTGDLPAHLIARIQSGEPPTKVIREWRRLSQADLADRTGVAITQIMSAERGGLISKPALRLLARGLRVVDDLLIGAG